MARLENIHKEEKEAVEKLRLRVKDSLNADMYEDDVLLYRFLKARKFDLDKAECLLRECVKFRKQFQADTILQDFKPKEVFLKYLGRKEIGTDKEGNLLIYHAFGKLQIQDIIRCYKYNNLLRHFMWIAEYYSAALKQENLKSGRNSWKSTYIVDLDKLALSNTCHPLSLKLLSIVAVSYQVVFPETLNAIYVINAPVYYTLLFAILKRVLDDAVVNKIHFFGRNGWKEELLNQIEADVLPVFLGGSRTDPDGNPMCNTIIGNTGKVPAKYYLSKKDKTFRNISQVKHATIYAGNTHEVLVEVKDCGSTIQWEFEVPKSDIGFGIFFEESKQGRKEIIPIYRFETFNDTADDSYRCQCTGTYVVVFDNTYSWFSKKELSYCISVVSPDDDLSKCDSSNQEFLNIFCTETAWGI